MLASKETRDLLKRTAAALAEWPPAERAWYVTYLLELLEEKADAEETRTTLEVVKQDIETRLSSGRW